MIPAKPKGGAYPFLEDMCARLRFVTAPNDSSQSGGGLGVDGALTTPRKPVTWAPFSAQTWQSAEVKASRICALWAPLGAHAASDTEVLLYALLVLLALKGNPHQVYQFWAHLELEIDSSDEELELADASEGNSDDDEADEDAGGDGGREKRRKRQRGGGRSSDNGSNKKNDLVTVRWQDNYNDATDYVRWTMIDAFKVSGWCCLVTACLLSYERISRLNASHATSH